MSTLTPPIKWHGGLCDKPYNGRMTNYRPVPSFPGYRAGDDGSIWSCWKGGGQHATRRMIETWKRLVPTSTRTGHLRLNIALPDGDRKYISVHEMILDAWHGPCPEGCEARHLNDKPADNRPENLCWGTRVENMADRKRNGIWVHGARSWNAKLTDADAAEIIRRCAAGESQQSIADSFGVNQSQVSRIVRGQRWSHLA